MFFWKNAIFYLFWIKMNLIIVSVFVAEDWKYELFYQNWKNLKWFQKNHLTPLPSCNSSKTLYHTASDLLALTWSWRLWEIVCLRCPRRRRQHHSFKLHWANVMLLSTNSTIPHLPRSPESSFRGAVLFVHKVNSWPTPAGVRGAHFFQLKFSPEECAHTHSSITFQA